LKCRAVADSLEEAGDRLFTFTRFPPSQWKSIRTSNAIKRLHEEFKRRIKTQTVLPCAETAAMLFWALMASGQIAILLLRVTRFSALKRWGLEVAKRRGLKRTKVALVRSVLQTHTERGSIWADQPCG
jgi:transposase-like protein